jgi:GT2 family glycosyltransferase
LSDRPEIAVIVSTYQRPQHLRRCLLSLARQRGVDGRFEAVVVDDGSADDTADLVARFARTAPFRLAFTTHEHRGFQLARCRNSGVRRSTAPYLLFTDGDCFFPADHLERHLAARRPGVVRAGHCVRLDEATSARVDDAAIDGGAFVAWTTPSERKLKSRNYRKALFYQLIRHPERPKLVGWNIAIARADLERVNGFDELYRGWGCEDDDLRRRLRDQGVRIATSIGYTHGFHLWHPPHATTPQKWHEGQNVGYYYRPLVLSRCLAGIERRAFAHLGVRVLGGERHAELARQLAAHFPVRGGRIELELLVAPSAARFSREVDGRVLIVPAGERASRSATRAAHAVVQLAAHEGAREVIRELQRLLGLAGAADADRETTAA